MAMRKIGLVALLLAACGSEPAGITIAITADGFVKVDGKAVTLDELGTLLAARRDAGPREQVAEAVGLSALAVLLDVEDDATWRHVDWVMVILAEQKFWRVSLPGDRAAPLPVAPGIWPSGPPPDGSALLIRVLVLETGAYALRDRTTGDVEELGRWIDEAKGDGVLCRIGGLAADARATWRQLRPAFDLLRRRGVKRIELLQCGIPPRSVRLRSPMLAPRAVDVPARWSGIFVVGYRSELDVYEDPLELEIEEPVPDEDLLGLLVAHRVKLGLAVFATNEALRKTASLHAKEMDRLGYFGHFSPVPGNRSPSDRLAKQGWPEERRHAELLAKADTEQAAFEALLAKPENVKILADPSFKYAGVARSGDLWVVLLGEER
jgi:biopolymer transport protein ExbD